MRKTGTTRLDEWEATSLLAVVPEDEGVAEDEERLVSKLVRDIRMAGDEGTAEAELERLAESEDKWVLRKIALNPGATPKLLAKLRSDDAVIEEAVRARLESSSAHFRIEFAAARQEAASARADEMPTRTPRHMPVISKD
jgi:hypothetical protein